MVAENQHGFVKVESCLTNLVTFFGEANKLVDKGIMIDITNLVYNFPKSFKGSKKSEDKEKDRSQQ